MRVLVAIGCTLFATAGVSFAQPTEPGRRSIVDVVEEDVNGRAPVRREGRPAANESARTKLDRGDNTGAVDDLRGAIADGSADTETHYMLAEGLLNQAKALRERADAAAARGDQAEAARLRGEAEGRIGEALGALGRGRDHAYGVIDERLAAGDAAGARNLANALLRVDPSDARARSAMTAADGLTAASRPASSSPWGGTSGGSGGATTTGGNGDAGARSVWDRYGSDPDSVWDRAVANANRATGTSTTPTTTTPTTTAGTPTTTTPTTSTPEVQPTATTDERPAATARDEEAPALGRPGMRVSAADLEVLARIIKGEALVCSFEGKVAVAAVVLNRVRDSRWPNTIPGVAHQPLQFSCYNRNFRQELYYGPVPEECYRAARAALAGQDPTGGATHYYNPYLVQPSWARNLRQTRRIGTNRNDTHVFFR